MNVYYDTVPMEHNMTSVSLGFFDGMHLGHKEVILNSLEYAKEKVLYPIVFTFDKNPRLEFDNSNPNATSLITQKDKIKLLEELGVKATYFIPFSSIKDLDAETFFKEILVDKLNAKSISCGFNYHFGKDGKGDKKLLLELCQKYSVSLILSTAVKYKGEPISSTRIRDALRNGEISSVNTMLGRKFSITSNIIHGAKIGRTLGVPTINQVFEDNFTMIKFGVYATSAVIDGIIYYGVTNVGVKPTVTNENKPICETWFPEYAGEDLYNKEITISFIDFIREEKKFDNLIQLKERILKDEEEARKLFYS